MPDFVSKAGQPKFIPVTGTKYQGSGIGLSHCEKIVELNHVKFG